MTRWRAKLLSLFLIIASVIGLLRTGLDWVGYYTSLMDVLKALKSLINSPLVFPLLFLAGIASFIWLSYRERRRRQTLPSALVHVGAEERLIARDGIGFTIRGVGTRAVILWFENQTKYKLERVRALLHFATSRDTRIDYTGLWLDESRRDIQFSPNEKKGLVLIIERDGKYFAPSERRENDQHQLMTEFHPIGDETCIIHLTLSVEGASGPRQPRFQIVTKPQLEVLTFWH